ncbi:MAG TPA: thioredoxin domain-containing protein [Pyrinomonadaceae bacterium]|nr:thioredoxin domain-containing protein [Pyrinomonadaceae bacterium]
MISHSSQGIRVCLCLVFLFVTAARAQTPDPVLASVNGVSITQKQVDDSIAVRLFPLQQQLYAIRKSALENLIVSRLLETEAKARGVSVEELRRQLTQGEIRVTRTQVEEAYAQNSSFFAAMSPDEARERLRLDLENQARMKHYRTAIDGLRKKWTVRVNFTAPAFALDDGSSPARGSAMPAVTPTVTIVEFSDFECRFCRDVQPALKQILESYGDVRLVFKHLPLEGHRNSLPAARAAYCAGEQDRFWPFHDALFAARSLSAGLLDQIASELGLGMARFQACMSSERSRTAILRDMEMARSASIDSTPSFLVNGKLIKGALSFPEFQKIIERERVTQTLSSQN